MLYFARYQIVTGLETNPNRNSTTIYMYELTVLAGFVSTRTFCCFVYIYYNQSLHRDISQYNVLLGPVMICDWQQF